MEGKTPTEFNQQQEGEIPESEKNLASYFMLELEQKDREADINIRFIFEPTPMEIEGPMTDVMLMGLAVTNVIQNLKGEIEQAVKEEFVKQKTPEEMKNNIVKLNNVLEQHAK